MPERSWLSERRLAGLMLTIGAVVFLAAAGLPLWDSNMKSVYSMPLRERFTFILENAALWGWACALFIAGALITLYGLVLLADLLGDAGEHVFSRLSRLTLVMGVTIWIVEMGFRISVGGWERPEATTPEALNLFLRFSGWVQVTFIVYTVLMLVGTAAYGASLLATRLLPRWAGWTAVAFGLLGLAVLLAFGDVPPLVAYLPSLIVGIRLLIPSPSQVAVEGKTETQASLQSA